MKLIHCDQGSPEWHAARAGCITASMFKTARAKLKRSGEPTEAALDYAFGLAIERISGVPLDEGFETWQMRRGHELEPAARLAHEASAGVIVQRAGFVTTDDGVFGASADGLIDDDAGSEYKCLIGSASLRDVLLDDDISDYVDQIQGCMWITGRRYWHFALYCPALAAANLDLTWRRVERDDDYIEALETDLMAFKAIVDENESILRRRAA